MIKIVTNSIDISTLYDRLNKLGLSPDFVRQNGLPEWWTEECETLPDASITVATYLAQRFNLEFKSLIDPNFEPVFQQSNQTRYKTQNTDVSKQLNLASFLALRIAELVVYAYPQEYQTIEGITADKIRTYILNQNQTVSLRSLLSFCQAHGIPVVHFANFPKTVKKFYGMVTRCATNPVVVLSLRDPSPSRLAFILAHELGHIALKHLEKQETISDEEIKTHDLQDAQESEANEFAAELILGEPDKIYYFPRYMKAEVLANRANEKAILDQVDPGAIAWNYSWYEKKHFPIARKAAKILEKGANAPMLINEQLNQQLNWERLSDDNQEYLTLSLKLDETITGG
ncbi:MAG: ImmA/IrrE family metallo-endopeptidase [Symploca sp. SIO2E6]|nr:ImmA/IrrE family metallo-endopeptidase [Symploca sp. SIO2E6]